MLQGYGFKLPRDFVLGVPELAPFADLAGPLLQSTAVVAQEPGAEGQQYLTDGALRAAIEQRAMRAATGHFEGLGYVVVDVSRTMPYDLHATRAQEELHVEVKGTTGTGSAVFLTRNEVQHAKANPDKAVLFELSGVDVRSEPSGEPSGVVAFGGTAALLMPWTVDDRDLDPLQFRYAVPPTHV